MASIALALHGGAGLIKKQSLSPQREQACRIALQDALDGGLEKLHAGGCALDAVQETVHRLEDSPLFNAALGAVLTRDGRVELDAAIMDGRDGAAGAIAAATRIRHPIQAARCVLDHSPHLLIAGPGADTFALEHGLTLVDNHTFITDARRQQLERGTGLRLDHDDEDVYGTVGAVACDASGNVAAATSTGGMVGQHPGRIGDTPILGAGTFASNATAAISATGQGEAFMHALAAARVAHRMEFQGLSLEAATLRVLQEDLPPASGGFIAVDSTGHVVMPFTTAGMFRAAAYRDGRQEIAIW
jgi:beta-aspartyl-peptidase (threonine type)